MKVFKTTWSTKKEGRRQAPNLSTGFRVSDVSHELMQRTETRKNSNKLFCSPVRIYCLGCKLQKKIKAIKILKEINPED